MFEIATEAMAAQVQSKFGRELDALWQKVIDYRDTKLKDETNYRRRLRSIKEFFEKNCAKQFMDLTWKYTGLWIETVNYVDLWESGFCTWIFLNGEGKKDQSGTFQIENMIDGGYLSRYWNFKIPQSFTAEQLMALASSYDAMSGSITPSKRTEMRKYVKSELGFDLRTGFLLEDYLPANSGVENFTARELTAIILHEIGHTLTLVEHAGDMYAHTASFSYLTQAFKIANNGKTEEVIKLGKLAAAKAEATGRKDLATKLTNLINKVEGAIQQAGPSADPKAKRTFLAGLIDSIFVIIWDIIVIPLTMIFGNGGTTARFDGTAGQKNKVGDIPINVRMINWQERKADEYAFTHGYGADQVKALDKLGKLIARLGKTPRQIENISAAERLNKDISFLAKMKLLIYAPLYAGSYGYNLYPVGSQRFREILNLTINQLKANGADPEYVRKYMEDIEAILYKIDHCNKEDEFIARMIKGYDIFLKYLTIPSIFDSIVHGKVMREIETLVNDLESLSGNLLFYYGLKLQEIAKKG